MSISDPYAFAAQAYIDAGWCSPIPLGRAGERAVKAPVPTGYTGRDAKIPSESKIAEWLRTHRVNNIGLHIAPELNMVCIDVDNYTKGSKIKTGGATIEGLEDELGPLPPTLRSSARPVDEISGVRFYRVPPGLEFATKFPDVEIIQPKHRYVAVWPSIHPETEQRYHFYTADGVRLKSVPRPEDVAELPPPWIQKLLEGATGGKGLNAHRDSEVDPQDWLDEDEFKHPCRAMRSTTNVEVSRFAEADSGARYDCMVAGVMALVRLSAEGHHGIARSLERLRAAYFAAVSDEPSRDVEGEWDRATCGAIERVSGTEADPHGPQCPDRARKGGADGDSPVWPSPNEPFEVAQRFTDELFSYEGLPTLRYWRGDFLSWTGPHWAVLDEAALRARIYETLSGAVFMTAAAQPVETTWKPNANKVSHVVDALKALCHFEGDDGAPDVISFANGSLVLGADGSRVLADHSPAWFNLNSLPYVYEAEPEAPKTWLRFLDEVFEADDESILLLQQWLGYLVTNQTAQQKMLLLWGPPRAGKGVIARVCEKLVGRANIAAPTLAQFGTNFGLQSTIGKSLAIIGDARFSGSGASQSVIVERLLSMVGDDPMTIDRKNRLPWTGHTSCRIMILSNELPSLNEASGALASRFVGPLHLSKSHLGKEDLGLEARLSGELSGIMQWALDGADDLAEAGRFVTPAHAVSDRRDMEELSSPEMAFMRECAYRKPTGQVLTIELYRAFDRWCEQQGRRNVPTFPIFCRNLRAAYPDLIFARTKAGMKRQVQVIEGVALYETEVKIGGL